MIFTSLTLNSDLSRSKYNEAVVGLLYTFLFLFIVNRTIWGDGWTDPQCDATKNSTRWVMGNKMGATTETSIMSQPMQWLRHLVNADEPGQGCCASNCTFSFFLSPMGRHTLSSHAPHAGPTYDTTDYAD